MNMFAQGYSRQGDIFGSGYMDVGGVDVENT